MVEQARLNPSKDGGSSPTSPLQIGKAWQRQIREKKGSEKCDMFGEWWRGLDIDIRKAIVKEIEYDTAKSVILEYEWLGTMGTTQKHYGIYFDNHLAGVVCYGYFQSMQGYAKFVGEKHSDKGIQLSRGACVHWAHEHSASKLIGFSLRDLAKKGYKYAIAFSDPEAGEVGTVYQATNWHYLGFGKTTHFNLVRCDGMFFMNDRDFNKKYGFKNLQKFLAENPTIHREDVKPKARYIKLLGTSKENSEMMSMLSERIQSYPKRNAGIKAEVRQATEADKVEISEL